MTTVAAALLAVLGPACAESKGTQDAKPPGASGVADTSARRPTPTAGGSTSTLVTGLYLATAVTEEPGVWLVFFDPHQRSGRLYDPPRVSELCAVVADSAPNGSGRISWRTPADGGVVFGFDGRAIGGEMVGRLSVFRRLTDRDSALRSDSVVMRQVGDLAAPGVPTGVYSSFDYNEEGGDLLGSQLVLVRSTVPGSPLAGLLSVAQGSVGAPAPLTDIVSSGDSVQFTARVAGSDLRYTARLSANGATLAWKGQPDAPEQLRRLAGVQAYLTRDMSGRAAACPRSP